MVWNKKNMKREKKGVCVCVCVVRCRDGQNHCVQNLEYKGGILWIYEF